MHDRRTSLSRYGTAIQPCTTMTFWLFHSSQLTLLTPFLCIMLDGSFVVRDPNNNCQFFPCNGVICTPDIMRCPGTCELYVVLFAVWKTLCSNLIMFPLLDGTFVYRDPRNNCNFFPCRTCPLDVSTCSYYTLHKKRAQSRRHAFKDWSRRIKQTSLGSSTHSEHQTCLIQWLGSIF